MPVPISQFIITPPFSLLVSRFCLTYIFLLLRYKVSF